MNAADYVIATALAVSLAIGAVRGFMREAIGLLGWLGGLWLAWRYAHWVTPFLGGMLADEPLRSWVARAIILVGTLLVAWAVSGVLAYFVRQSGLSETLDRVLGGLFGVLRGAVLVALTVMLGQKVQLNEVTWWKESRLVPYAVKVSEWIYEFAESALESQDPVRISSAVSKREA